MPFPFPFVPVLASRAKLGPYRNRENTAPGRPHSWFLPSLGHPRVTRSPGATPALTHSPTISSSIKCRFPFEFSEGHMRHACGKCPKKSWGLALNQRWEGGAPCSWNWGAQGSFGQRPLTWTQRREKGFLRCGLVSLWRSHLEVLRIYSWFCAGEHYKLGSRDYQGSSYPQSMSLKSGKCHISCTISLASRKYLKSEQVNPS